MTTIVNIYNSSFNMSFGYLRTDTCLMCDQLEIQLSSADDTTKSLVMQQKEVHLCKAETFYIIHSIFAQPLEKRMTIGVYMHTRIRIASYHFHQFLRKYFPPLLLHHKMNDLLSQR